MADERLTTAGAAGAQPAGGRDDRAAALPAAAPAKTAAMAQAKAPASKQGRRTLTHPDPTRYGDWEKGGRCIDF